MAPTSARPSIRRHHFLFGFLLVALLVASVAGLTVSAHLYSAAPEKATAPGVLNSSLLPARGGFRFGSFAPAPTTATVTTDRQDYHPGETVNISGTGFQPGETVSLQVLHADGLGDDLTSPAHQPWYVGADANGDLQATWIVPADEDEAGATLQLTATGVTSGSQAVSIFTDSLTVAPTFITKWGSSGSSNGQFFFPRSAAVDGSGNVYVLDQGNRRIQKFDRIGTFLLKWGTLGSADGQFNNPLGVAVDGSGNVYVADQGNNRVQKFNASGTFLLKWGTLGSGNGQFNAPWDVATDSSGNVYVADGNNRRIQKFDSNGTFLLKWGSAGSLDGQFSLSQLFLAVDQVSGNVFVGEENGTRIQKFNSSGTFLLKWGTSGTGNGQFNFPSDAAVDSNGNVYIADANNNRIQMFNSSGTFLVTWGTAGTGNGQFNRAFGVAVDGNGNVYAVDQQNHRMEKFTFPDHTSADVVYGQGGSFTTNTANNGGVTASSLNYTGGMAFDNDGNLYVCDVGNNRVLFYPSGSSTAATRVYGQFGSFSTNTANNGGVSADSLNTPLGVALDSGGNLYVADLANSRVLFYPAGSTTATRVYGQGGSFATNTQNNGGISADSLRNTAAVKLDSGDNLYVADQGNNRVLFYPAGSTTATRVYGQGGSFNTNTQNTGGISANSLSSPTDIASGSGGLYVGDGNNRRVLFYPGSSTTATRVYGQFGNFTTGIANNGGVSANSLAFVEGVTVDSGGNLYVSMNQNRVLFYPASSTTATRVYGQNGIFTTQILNNGGITANSLNYAEAIILDHHDKLYVADANNNRVLGFTNQPPTVSAGGPYSGSVGSAIAISGATAADPNPADTLTYAWTVNSPSCSFNNAGILSPSVTCTIVGNFTATLSVSDGVNPAVVTNASVAVNKISSTTTVTCTAGAPYTYTGSAQTPCTAGYTTSDGLSGSLTVSYTDNTNAGTAGASASYPGDANHKSSDGSSSFVIGKASSSVTVDCTAGAPFTYTGSAQTPCTATATGVGGLNVAVTVVYGNNTNAGTATANATYDGDDNHTGSTASEKTFTINKAPTTTVVTFESGPYVFRGSAFTATAQVTGAGGLNQSQSVSYTGNCTFVTMPGGCSATATYAETANYLGSTDSKSITILSGCTLFDGFRSPIGGAVENGNGGSSLTPVRTFKLGSTIPVKFGAMCFGTPLTTGVHVLHAQKWNSGTSMLADPIDATPTDAATTGIEFRLTGTEWHYNLDTKNTPGFSEGTWLLKATLYDGSSYSVWVAIKR